MNSLIHGSIDHLAVLKKNWKQRARFCFNNGPSASFRRYTFLCQSQYIINDFAARYCKKAEGFQSRFLREIAPRISEMARDTLSEERIKGISEANSFDPASNDYITYGGVLSLLALFEDADKRRKPARIKHVYINFVNSFSAGSALAQVKTHGITQPVIVAYGAVANKYVIALEGSDVTVTGCFADALLAYVASFWLFNLDLPAPVRQEVALLARLVGTPDPSLGGDASRLYREITGTVI